MYFKSHQPVSMSPAGHPLAISLPFARFTWNVTPRGTSTADFHGALPLLLGTVVDLWQFETGFAATINSHGSTSARPLVSSHHTILVQSACKFPNSLRTWRLPSWAQSIHLITGTKGFLDTQTVKLHNNDQQSKCAHLQKLICLVTIIEWSIFLSTGGVSQRLVSCGRIKTSPSATRKKRFLLDLGHETDTRI